MKGVDDMTFGTTIKKLRHDADITQEKLAEYLNISAQAVSRWETDLAMPDIMLLPKLANIFDVTTDFLLGVDITLKQDRINEIIALAQKPQSEGDGEKVIKIWRAALDEFPNNYFIMSQLAHVLLYNDSDNDSSKKEAIDLSEKVLGECTEDETRHDAIQTLCFL